MANVANVYDVITADRQGPPPLVINVLTRPRTMEFVGGVPETSTRAESYVLFSALPEELQKRVRLSIEALQSSV